MKLQRENNFHEKFSCSPLLHSAQCNGLTAYVHMFNHRTIAMLCLGRHGICQKLYTDICFFIKSFTPKYSVNYGFLGHQENINLPLCYLNIILYTCLYLCYSIFALLDKKYNKKDFKIAKRREFTTNSVCSKLYFTPGR